MSSHSLPWTTPELTVTNRTAVHGKVHCGVGRGRTAQPARNERIVHNFPSAARPHTIRRPTTLPIDMTHWATEGLSQDFRQLPGWENYKEGCKRRQALFWSIYRKARQAKWWTRGSDSRGAGIP